MVGQVATRCNSAMSKLQVRLDKDVESLVKKSAKDNSRTVPREVNHLLREVLKPKKNDRQS